MVDPTTVASIASGANTAGCCLVGVVQYVASAVKKLRSAYYILVPSGKTSLVNAFAGTHSFNFVDLDALAYNGEEDGKALIKAMLTGSFEQFKIKYFPVIKNQVDALLSNLSGTFVFISSNYPLLKHVCNMNSSNKNLLVYLPSATFKDASLLASNGTSADPSYVSNYNAILAKFGSSPNLNTFTSWNDLQNQIANDLDISAKL